MNIIILMPAHITKLQIRNTKLIKGSVGITQTIQIFKKYNTFINGILLKYVSIKVNKYKNNFL